MSESWATHWTLYCQNINRIQDAMAIAIADATNFIKNVLLVNNIDNNDSILCVPTKFCSVCVNQNLNTLSLSLQQNACLW